MYYPYLRGKQYELILLRENAKLIASNQIYPIIEPVKNDFSPLKRTLEALIKLSIKFTIIVNPISGKRPVSSEQLHQEVILPSINAPNMSIGFILHSESNINHLESYIQKNEPKNISLLHYGYSDGNKVANITNKYSCIDKHIFFDSYPGKLYQTKFHKDGIARVLIRNGFKSDKRNADYPLKEHFSDLHITYPLENMDGFGDFLIVGEEYTETGGPAYAVAIHITYLSDDDDMYIYHFVSDQKSTPTNPGGKFHEANTKLVKQVEKQKTDILKSSAIEHFISLYKKEHYPGLGFAKKLSMQHHLELISHYQQKRDSI